MRSEFDGLGHYRAEEQRGTLLESDLTKPLTSRTEYNPTCGTYEVNAAGDVEQGIDTGCAPFQKQGDCVPARRT